MSLVYVIGLCHDRYCQSIYAKLTLSYRKMMGLAIATIVEAPIYRKLV